MHKPKLSLNIGSLLNAQPQNGHREYRARFVKAGRVRAAGNQESSLEILPGALSHAAQQGMFDQKAVFVDHAGWFEYPSLERLVGVTFESDWNESDQAVEGHIRLYDTPGGKIASRLIDELLSDPEMAPDIGLSIVFYPRWESPSPKTSSGGSHAASIIHDTDDILRITGIDHIESIDLVFEPAADGRILQALSSLSVSSNSYSLTPNPKGEPNMTDEQVLTENERPAAEAEPVPGEAEGTPPVQPPPGSPTPEPPTTPAPEPATTPAPEPPSTPVPEVPGSPAPEPPTTPAQEPPAPTTPDQPPLSTPAPEPSVPNMQPATPNLQPAAPNLQPAAPNLQPAISNSQSAVPNSQLASSTWIMAMADATTRALINASDLPKASRERLLQNHYNDPEQLHNAIQSERAYVAHLRQDSVVQIGGQPPRSPQFSGITTSLDRVQKALGALFDGTRPPDGIQPLSGIRELYHLLSGDYEMSGLFHSDRITLANVNSSTMAGLVANALNKRLINEFQQYPQWWTPIASEEDFSNLQQVKWITLGGVGELPTVAEGAAYTELTWDDATETADFVKKGGYLGLTLEAIDKDDTGRIRFAPRALAQGAWLTLSKAISSIFTANSGVGPTMADGDALFHSNHANLGTTALSFAEYTAVRTAMRKQTELHSGERLGTLTAPRYLLVPPDLEITALQILASEGQTGTPNNDINPHAEGDGFSARMSVARDRVIVVDLWTDTNNWAAAADPRLYPTLGIAYRYGRVPEIFSVASPTAGLMFTNDTMPVKVRYFFATGPMDYRGLYKENVA